MSRPNFNKKRRNRKSRKRQSETSKNLPSNLPQSVKNLFLSENLVRESKNKLRQLRNPITARQMEQAFMNTERLGDTVQIVPSSSRSLNPLARSFVPRTRGYGDARTRFRWQPYHASVPSAPQVKPLRFVINRSDSSIEEMETKEKEEEELQRLLAEDREMRRQMLVGNRSDSSREEMETKEEEKKLQRLFAEDYEMMVGKR